MDFIRVLVRSPEGSAAQQPRAAVHRPRRRERKGRPPGICRDQDPGPARGHGREAPGGEPMIPDWLEPIRQGAESITVHDLTRFMPPEGSDPRRGAVLMLFGEDEHGPELLLTERSHTMRSHPGQVSFPGGGIAPGETAHEAALREAWEETGLNPDGVELRSAEHKP